MAIKRDHTDRNSFSDTPPDWARYAGILRQHGQAQPDSGFERRIEIEWEDRLAQHKRHKARQRTLAPLLTLAVAGAGFIIVSSSIGPNVAMAPNPIPNIAAPVVADDESDNFADPDIPPVWVDTTLPMIDPSILPGMAIPSMQGVWVDTGFVIDPPVAGE